MTQPHLLACPSCARHVRASEASCPFCETSIASALAGSPPRQRPRERLSRAALVAFGIGSASVVACGGAVQGGGTGGGSTSVDSGGGRGSGGGGGGGGGGGEGDSGDDTGQTILPPYGISPPFDAGEPDDADVVDSGEDVIIGTAYGIAVFDADFPDAGEADGGSDAAGAPRDAGFAPPYGAPPH
jgi:hypothetical protein